jgi:EmrB/QacA subfamily drug resistance transporter
MGSAQRWTLVATVLSSAVVFLDSTVVNVALPKIGAELKSGFFGALEAQSYVYNGYLLTLSALLILAGALSDRYGRKRVFSAGLILFAVTSALCGIALSMDALILARLAQGAAGALLVPGALALINAAFSGDERGRAFGIWSSASAAMTVIGPTVGGVLVDGAGWRVAFLINLPLLLAAWFALRGVPDDTGQASSERLDWRGASVVALATGGLAFGAIRGQERNWVDPLAFVALGVGVLAALAFIPLMRATTSPLVPLSLFNSRNFATINLSTFLIYGALYVSGYYQAIFLQGTLGYTALAAGLAGLPTGVLLALFSARIGGLTARVDLRVFLALGPALMALGTLLLARVPPGSTPWRAVAAAPLSLIPSSGYLTDLLPGLLVFALGLLLLVAPLTTALMASVPQQRSGLGSAINNAISRVGPQLAGALIFVFVTGVFYANLAQRTGLDVNRADVRERLAPLNAPRQGTSQTEAEAARLASHNAFSTAMLLCAGLLAAGAAVNAVGLRPSSPREPTP